MNNDFLPYRVVGKEDAGFQPDRIYPGIVFNDNHIRIANDEGRTFLVNADQVRLDVPTWRKTMRYATLERSTEEVKELIGKELLWLISKVNELSYIKSKAKLDQSKADLMSPVRTIAEIIGDEKAVDLAYADHDAAELEEEIVQ